MAEAPTNTCRVLILDDESSKGSRLCDQLSALRIDGLTVNAPSIKDVEREFEILYARRSDLGAGKAPLDSPTLIDGADVLLVDFDLRDLNDHFGFATGEEIAYSARLFSSAKVIAVLNHPNIGLNAFDLTLQRDREFRADVYIGSEQCTNPALWTTRMEHEGFLPWNWTPLTEDAQSFERCVFEVQSNLDAPVLKYFGLDAIDATPSLEMLGYLGLTRGDDVPFGQLLQNSTVSYVRQKDLAPLLLDKKRYARVVAALVRKWFRRWVLPSQVLLADLPHFSKKLPWALSNYEDRRLWDAVASCGRSIAGCDLSTLFRKGALDGVFGHASWVGRPTFLLTRARSSFEKEGSHLSDFKSSSLPDISFAEDLSRFVDSSEVIEYSLTLDGEAQVRSISDRAKIKIKGPSFDLDRVIYSPESLIL